MCHVKWYFWLSFCLYPLPAWIQQSFPAKSLLVIQCIRNFKKILEINKQNLCVLPGVKAEHWNWLKCTHRHVVESLLLWGDVSRKGERYKPTKPTTIISAFPIAAESQPSQGQCYHHQGCLQAPSASKYEKRDSLLETEYFLSHMKCFASESWSRLPVNIIDVKFSLLHFDTSVLKPLRLVSGSREHTALSFASEPWGAGGKARKEFGDSDRLEGAAHCFCCSAAGMAYRLSQDSDTVQGVTWFYFVVFHSPR